MGVSFLQSEDPSKHYIHAIIQLMNEVLPSALFGILPGLIHQTGTCLSETACVVGVYAMLKGHSNCWHQS
jgi:hypothetical protein